MDCNKEEAARAKVMAERKMQEKDFFGAKRMVLKAQQLFPDLENVSQMLTVCEVHCAASVRKNGEHDWYKILQVQNSADESLIKKQYRKLALLLHPDKNKFEGAEAAFKLVGEANMTLADRLKRSQYDVRLNSAGRTVLPRPHYQQSRNSANNVANFNTVNPQLYQQQKLHQQQKQPQQQQTSTLQEHEAFWTMCPSCGVRYQFYRNVLEKALRCQHCLKTYIARDLGLQAVPPVVNSASRVHGNSSSECHAFSGEGQPSNINSRSSRNGVDCTGRVEVNAQMNFVKVDLLRKKSNQDVVRQPTVNLTKPAPTARRKRGRKVVESSDSETSSDSDVIVEAPAAARNAGQAAEMYPRRSSRQKQNVTYMENGSDAEEDNEPHDVQTEKNDFDSVAPNLKRLRKGDSSNVGESSEVSKSKAENGCTVMSNGNSEAKETELPEDEENSASLGLSYADPEFFDFETCRDASTFRSGQIWAVYDDLDGMPRFYARIKAVLDPNSTVKYSWLEYDPSNEKESEWLTAELPVACGNFKIGRTETTKKSQMFSHPVDVEKVSRRNSYHIYPRKGEIWALYKDWSMTWRLHADEHKTYEYEVVEVIGDLKVGPGINVVPLVKIEGFVSLFMQLKGSSTCMIPRDEILRFSHCVPSHRMTGSEREDVPEGAIELDPASLPPNLEEAFTSVAPETCSVKNLKTDASQLGSTSSGFQHTDLGSSSQQRKEDVPSKSHKQEKLEAGKIRFADDDSGDGFDVQSADFNNFALLRTLDKFCNGQIWALYCDIDGFPKYYAHVKKVDRKENRVHTRWLEPLPSGEEEQRLVREGVPLGWGTFTFGTDEPHDGTNSFSHLVHAEHIVEKNNFEILPRVGEIWALYRNWRCGWTPKQYEDSCHDLVEVCGSSSSTILVAAISKVRGYISVFRPSRETSRMEIRRSEFGRFSHQIPFFKLDSEEAELAGCWELDPASLSEVYLSK